jgi:hypothetical protein
MAGIYQQKITSEKPPVFAIGGAISYVHGSGCSKGRELHIKRQIQF